jgi:EF hand
LLRMISLVPGMRHGHGPAWTRNESYAFAESVVMSGKPWCSQSSASVSDGKANVTWTIVGKQQIDQARLDADSNGTISTKEYIAHYGSVFDQLDKDRSGKLDNREFTNAAAIRAGDGDSDGKLTKNEYRSFFEKQFSNLDIDKNGVLTKKEWK